MRLLCVTAARQSLLVFGALVLVVRGVSCSWDGQRAATSRVIILSASNKRRFAAERWLRTAFAAASSFRGDLVVRENASRGRAASCRGTTLFLLSSGGSSLAPSWGCPGSMPLLFFVLKRHCSFPRVWEIGKIGLKELILFR